MRTLKHRGVRLNIGAVGKPTANGFGGRLTQSIREEEGDLSECQNYHNACRQMGRLLEDACSRKRIRLSLGCLPPVECEAQRLAECRDPAGVV